MTKFKKKAEWQSLKRKLNDKFLRSKWISLNGKLNDKFKGKAK